MALKRIKLDWQLHGYLPFAFMLFTYTLCRAVKLSITHDEAMSYFFFIKDSYAHIISNHDLSALNANNHILHSLLARFFTQFLPLSELTLRLPALIGHLLFLVYSWKLLQKTQSIIIKIGAYLLLNVQPYMMDFFSLSRGYGLSIGCMVAGLFYLKCLFEKDRNLLWSLLLCYVFMGLAVLANLSLLIPFVALLPITMFATFIHFRQANKKNKAIGLILSVFFVMALIVIPLLLFAVQTGLKLKDAGALFYGGDTSFWKDTVLTLGSDMLYGVSSAYILGISFFNFLKVLICIIVLAITLSLKASPDRKMFLSLCAILIICVCANIAQHHFLHVLFPVGRTALFYYPLFVLTLIYALVQISNRFKWTAFAIPGLAALGLLLFFYSFNLNYVLDWKGNAYTNEAARLLKERNKEYDNRISIVGAPWNDQPSFRFYKEMYNLGQVWLPFGDKSINYKEDIVFGPASNANELKLNAYREEKYFPVSNVNLYTKTGSKSIENKVLLQKQLKWGEYVIKPEEPLSGRKLIEVSPLHGSFTSSIYTNEWFKGDSSVFVQLNFDLFEKQLNNDCKVFIAMHNAGDSLYDFKVYPLAYEHIEANKFNNICVVFRMPTLKGDRSYLKLWFGNDGTESVFISNPEILFRQ